MFIFVILWSLVERGEKEGSLDSDGRERNLSLTPIYTTKIRDFCVKLFHLMRRVHIICFDTLNVREKTYMSSG